MMEQLKLLCSGCAEDETRCSAVHRAKATLLQYFKFPSFKPGQLEAIMPVLHCQDVFVRMATGSGKSLCMFLPPLCVGKNAMGAVISPLNALMEQQVRCTVNVW